jgi:heme oxygenase (biliverdin-producing, ferredoxin)
MVSDLTVTGFSLAAALHERTRDLHRHAERSGFVADMLRGRAGRDGYTLYMRNLLPAYQALEQGLESHRYTPGVGAMAKAALYRAPALESDLVGLAGRSWPDSVPVLPAGARYGERILATAQGDGARLVGHAYTRYLGDLSGGQILSRLLANSLQLGPTMLSFYRFPAIADVPAFKDAYRVSLERAADSLSDLDAVIDEAALAFQLNIDLSQAVQAAVATR